MDLRRKAPRAVGEKMAGYVHLGRMLDKCRATLASTHGDYIFPCPLDKRLLEFARITPEQFSEAIRHRSDTEAAAWFKQAARHNDSEVDAWNHTMLGLKPDNDEKWAYFKSVRDAIDPKRTDITTWADLLDLEEGRNVPQRRRASGESR